MRSISFSLPIRITIREGDFALEHGALRRSGPDRLTYSGIGLCSPAALRPVIAGAAALAPYLDRACERGAATGEVHRGEWDNVGTPAQLADARGRATPSSGPRERRQGR